MSILFGHRCFPCCFELAFSHMPCKILSPLSLQSNAARVRTSSWVSGQSSTTVLTTWIISTLSDFYFQFEILILLNKDTNLEIDFPLVLVSIVLSNPVAPHGTLYTKVITSSLLRGFIRQPPQIATEALISWLDLVIMWLLDLLIVCNIFWNWKLQNHKWRHHLIHMLRRIPQWIGREGGCVCT